MLEAHIAKERRSHHVCGGHAGKCARDGTRYPSGRSRSTGALSPSARTAPRGSRATAGEHPASARTCTGARSGERGESAGGSAAAHTVPQPHWSPSDARATTHEANPEAVEVRTPRRSVHTARHAEGGNPAFPTSHGSSLYEDICASSAKGLPTKAIGSSTFPWCPSEAKSFSAGLSSSRKRSVGTESFEADISKLSFASVSASVHHPSLSDVSTAPPPEAGRLRINAATQTGGLVGDEPARLPVAPVPSTEAASSSAGVQDAMLPPSLLVHGPPEHWRHEPFVVFGRLPCSSLALATSATYASATTAAAAAVAAEGRGSGDMARSARDAGPPRAGLVQDVWTSPAASRQSPQVDAQPTQPSSEAHVRELSPAPAAVPRPRRLSQAPPPPEPLMSRGTGVPTARPPSVLQPRNGPSVSRAPEPQPIVESCDSDPVADHQRPAFRMRLPSASVDDYTFGTSDVLRLNLEALPVPMHHSNESAQHGEQYSCYPMLLGRTHRTELSARDQGPSSREEDNKIGQGSGKLAPDANMAGGTTAKPASSGRKLWDKLSQKNHELKQNAWKRKAMEDEIEPAQDRLPSDIAKNFLDRAKRGASRNRTKRDAGGILPASTPIDSITTAAGNSGSGGCSTGSGAGTLGAVWQDSISASTGANTRVVAPPTAEEKGIRRASSERTMCGAARAKLCAQHIRARSRQRQEAARAANV